MKYLFYFSYKKIYKCFKFNIIFNFITYLINKCITLFDLYINLNNIFTYKNYIFIIKY